MAAEIDHVKEYKAHEGSYVRFLGIMKWGTILSAILVFIVVMLISS